MKTEPKAATADNVYSDAENFGVAETRRGKGVPEKSVAAESDGRYSYRSGCDGTGYVRPSGRPGDPDPCYDARLRPAARDLAEGRGEDPGAVLDARMAARAAARARAEGDAGEVHVGLDARVASPMDGPGADVLTAAVDAVDAWLDSIVTPDAVDAWLDSTVTPDLALCRSAVERAELRLSWVRHLLEVARPTDQRWLQALHRELTGALSAVESVRTVLVAEVPRGE